MQTYDTGKSLSEALISASTNPQYDNRLFIELRVQYMKIASSEHVVYTNCCFCFVLTFRTILVHNLHVLQMLRASEKGLPVHSVLHFFINRVY